LPATAEAPGTRHRTVLVLLGVAISGVLLWLAVRGLRLDEVWGHIRQVRPLPLLLAVTLATLTFPLRAVRWRLLLAEPGGRPVRFTPAWHAVAIGFMGNNLLPLRAGEVMRAYAVGRLAPVRTTSALASIAVERAFDALTVVAMLGIGLGTAGFSEEVRIGTLPVAALARRVAVLTGAVFVAAALVLLLPETTERLIRRLVPFPGLARRLVMILEGLRAGLSSLRSPARMLGTALWSVVVWGVNALSYFVLFPAFGVEADLGAALVVQGAVVFGVALPSSPGYIGVFELAVVVSLALYGVAQGPAFAFAVTYHAATFLPIILLGMYSLARTPIGWRDFRSSAS
jgi:uncharacterized protein (TIRG00374 family)